VLLNNTLSLLVAASLALLQGACATIDQFPSAPSTALPAPLSDSERQAEMAKIDFEIISGTAYDQTGDPFTLSMVPGPVISALGNRTYRMGIVFLWDPQSGRRYSVPLLTTFHYNGDEIIFFNDGNRNHKIDRWEASEQHDVSDKNKTGEIDLSISSEVIDNSPWYNLVLRLVFHD